MQATGAQQQPQAPRLPSAEHVVVRGADGLAYRRSVQVFIVNERGQFLVCCPVGPSNRSYRQTVQGGCEPGETPLMTALRETWEEIGLDLSRAGNFVAEVSASAAAPALSGANTIVASSSILGEGTPLNALGEFESEERAAFRYTSKKWRKEGICGQELYPLLYCMQSACIRFANVDAQSRGVRREFNRVYWGSLEELARCAPPSKQEVMSHVCPAVAATALPFFVSNNVPSNTLAPYWTVGM